MPHKIAILVGSLRHGSFTRMAAEALIRLAPTSLSMHIEAIGDLPLYNQDLDEQEGDRPAAWVRFRDAVRPSDGLLFVTPEYNRSVPGLLKNAIDVGSRPYGQSVFAGKPGAVMSVSPGAAGAFGANHHLRQSLVFLDVPTMQQPEAYVGGAANRFAAGGEVTDESTRKFLQSFIDAYAAWVDRFRP
ncbi:MAG TPA: NAD(P)H-dependent oxidoreductase [Caulobacteraceae bacterium]|jgi:chromate reductase